MTNISYVASPTVQVILAGDKTGTLTASTLTVTYNSQFVTLDDTVTTVVVYYGKTVGVNGETFGSPAELASYFNFLKSGGLLASHEQEVDITFNHTANTATISGVAGTFDIGSLTAENDHNGGNILETYKVKQGDNVILKGINPERTYLNGVRVSKDLHDLITYLNENFSWTDPEERETEAKEVSDRFGYAFTGGFAGKPVSNNYVWDAGNAISLPANTYTHMEFDTTVQEAVDSPYWSSPVPTGNGAHIGADVFEGIHLPDGVTNLFDYTYEWADGGIGRIDVSDAKPGDLLRVRMDYNVIPSIANSVIEAALDFNTRDNDDNITFQFYLTANPSTFGNTSAGQTYLLRTEMTAYFASNEDVNALVRPVIKCNNICQIQPLSILAILQK